MTFNKKLALVGIIGIAIIILVSMAGCGEVTASDPGADGGAGAGGKIETRADGGAAGEMTKLDGSAAGAAGTTVTFGRPLGAGCSADAQCGSSICDGVSHACCDGRTDACTVCTGGYKTPVPDGASACGTCRAGVLTDIVPDGTSCGATCGGMTFPTGFGNSTYTTTASNSTCHAGACVAETVDCSMKSCPSDCTKMYLGCFVNSQGSAESTSSGGQEAVAGAACRCVDTSGNFCSAGL
jgi:hypothetical protein